MIDDTGKHVTIFHTYVKCENRTCKLVIDNSSMNIASTKTFFRIRPMLKPHSNLYHLNPYNVGRSNFPLSHVEVLDPYWDEPLLIKFSLISSPWTLLISSLVDVGFTTSMQLWRKKNTYVFKYNGQNVNLLLVQLNLVEPRPWST